MKAERVVELFDEELVGPSAGHVPMMGGAGGGLPETYAADGDFVYQAGRAIPVGKMREEAASGDMEGYMMAGGARRRTRRRPRRLTRFSRQRGGKRRETRGQKKPAFRLNLRAQIRLRH